MLISIYLSLDNSDQYFSIDEILEQWRNSVSRQENDFVRRGESNAAIRTRTSRSKHSLVRKNSIIFWKQWVHFLIFAPKKCARRSIDGGSQAWNHNWWGSFAEREEDLQSALKKLEIDSNFCIPLSAKMDNKLSALPN